MNVCVSFNISKTVHVLHEMCYSPDLVHAPKRLTMLRWGPRWVMIFSSDIRACFSLERAVAERGYGTHDYHTLQSNGPTIHANQPRIQPSELKRRIWSPWSAALSCFETVFLWFTIIFSLSLHHLFHFTEASKGTKFITSWVNKLSGAVLLHKNLFFSNNLVLKFSSLTFCTNELIYHCSVL